VPAAYTVFALALGICMGAIWRKTIPAMATTIVVFAAIRIPVHSLRRDLISAQTKKVAAGAVAQLAHTPWPPGLKPGDWILRQTPAGAPSSGPPTQGPPAAVYHYIAAGQFWTLQSIETAIFLALTGALIGLCLIIVTRAHPH
jgi:hypothetical protein